MKQRPTLHLFRDRLTDEKKRLEAQLAKLQPRRPLLSYRQNHDSQHGKPAHNDQRGHRADGYFGFFFCSVGTHSTPQLAASFI